VAAWGAVDATLCGVTGFRLTGAMRVGTVPVLLLSVSLICHATHRLRVLRDLGELFALGIVTALIATIAFCCAVLNAAPLADDAFNAADLALGFDWPAWCRFVAPAQPILHLAYVSLFWQMAASLCWFAATNRTQRGREFMMITLLAMIPTVWALHKIPALGPLVDFGVTDRAPHVQTLLALRAGLLARDISQDAGFVCMPSFHTIWALALIWVHRDSRWTLPIVAPLNFVMLISLLSEGGHYLVDLIAGFVVAIVAISATRWGMRRSCRIPSVSGMDPQSA
jgi:membrane-associated phospholipid phosphatase